MTKKITIIGAGPGGYVAAIRAAQKGARVTVIEGSEVGGACLNLGCIPTKTLLSSVEALEHVRKSAAYGIEVPGDISYNLAKIRERKDKVVSTQIKGIQGLFKSWGVNLIEGRGSLLSPDAVRVVQKDGTTMDVKSDAVIVATGSRPARLPGFSFDGERIMSSDDAVQLKSVPARLLIIGAGVIGCEFAFIYQAFGSEVTMVEMMTHAVSTEDEEISELLERELKKKKIKLIKSETVATVAKDPDGTVVATLSSGQEIRTEGIIVSIGRAMNSENLGLDEVGVARGKRGEIVVNDRMETNIPGIYAVGDVTGTILLAHVASHQGIAAVENALGGDERVDYSVVPSGIFTMPEIGSVGLREKEAVERGITFKTGRFPFRGLGKAHAMGEITGMAKIIAEAETDKVLGVHICGAHATDLIHEGVLAIQMGATTRQLAHMIHAHPTLSEAIKEAAEDVRQMAIHAQKTEQ